MKLRNTLLFISILLIGYLLYDSTFEIDLAPTKNKHLFALNQAKIDSLQDVAALKTEAKSLNFAVINNFIHNANRAIVRFWCLILLLLLQLIIWWKAKYFTN